MSGAIFWTIIAWLVALVSYQFERKGAGPQRGEAAILFGNMVLATMATLLIWLLWALTPAG